MAEPNGEMLPGTIQMFVQGESGDLRDQELTLTPPPTNSPNDPLNWSPMRKYWHATLVLFITAMTAAIANDAGAASDGMLEELDISYAVANTAAGVLFASIGYWCLLASPMPWLYGRRIQYLICLLFGMIGSIWFARIQNRQDSIWNQMFVGASESCAEALAQLSLSDLFFQHQRGTVLGLYILATSIGTFLGPLIAGYIAIDSWRWVGWTAAIVCGCTFVVCYFGLEETSFHREAILGQHLGGTTVVTLKDDKKLSGDELGVRDSSDSGHMGVERKKTYRERIALITPAPNMIGLGFKQYVLRLWHTLRIFSFPAVLYSGLQWGAQDAWLTFYLTVEEDNYYDPPWNYSNQAVAIMNVPTLIGATIGCIYGGWFSDVFVKWMAKRRGGMSEAEDRLWLMYLSMLINPAGLMLFGIGSEKAWNWPGPYVGLAMIGFGFGTAGDLSMAYLMDCYPDSVLEGMVGVAVINNTLACIFTFVTSYWIEASGLANTFIAIGVLSLFFHSTTIPMMIYGKSCRMWTLQRYKRFLYLRDGER
ncbi:Putative major facilitator superfamily, MFS transporter superfamily [Septoria linicola]|uniref:Major facilitator superfamily, MFS transporter superfamily n=1 Tax=Septoria linicola TaxID=215465 RepID=A0A9Q9AUX6_9PEZI|nr:putative major facilitator superfamily, MFS transporter superfamily [Septoria linicola]USW56332.1 Putative major facilitator superfamily, MFS transporter superfamily [Septoria linicola]